MVNQHPGNSPLPRSFRVVWSMLPFRETFNGLLQAFPSAYYVLKMLLAHTYKIAHKDYSVQACTQPNTRMVTVNDQHIAEQTSKRSLYVFTTHAPHGRHGHPWPLEVRCCASWHEKAKLSGTYKASTNEKLMRLWSIVVDSFCAINAIANVI